MTTANKITILRILLVPFFAAQLLYYVDSGKEVYRFLALLSFTIAALSDSLDGYIARRYNQHSELGAILDPLADKLLLMSAIGLLSCNNLPYLDQFPLWLAATVFGRDGIILIGAAIIYYICGRVTVRPRFIGKIATVFQMVSVIWVLLKWQGDWLLVWMVIAAVCTGVSGLLYIRDGVLQLSASPSSSASPKS